MKNFTTNYRFESKHDKLETVMNLPLWSYKGKIMHGHLKQDDKSTGCQAARNYLTIQHGLQSDTKAWSKLIAIYY